MADLPTGTVTLLFTDIEGSTQLLQRLGPRYSDVLAEYRALLRSIFQAHGGQEVDTQGDSFFVAFPRALDAVVAAVEIQRAVGRHPWREGVTLATRMGLHTGEPQRGSEGYVGLDVHRAARIGAAGHGGQVLLSDATRGIVVHDLPQDVTLRDLGEHRLKDLRHPRRLWQLIIADLPSDFRPLRTLNARPNNLPVLRDPLVGRDQELRAVAALIRRDDVGLVTLTGAGGSGKTRLALQVAAELLDDFADGVFVVNLAPIDDPNLVLPTVARALDIREQDGRLLAKTLLDHLRHRRILLMLDNFEQIIPAAGQVVHWLASCPQLSVLVTSRAVLRAHGEHEYPVRPLALPRKPAEDDKHAGQSAADIAQYAAVALFIERAQAVKPDFVLTDENAPMVAEICRRLDGLPLAIELAAVRTKMLPIGQMVVRLDAVFQLLTCGHQTALPRHQTLRAAVDWSYTLLSEVERVLHRQLSVFAGGFTLEAAEGVCAGHGVDAYQLLDVLSDLVDQSLVMVQESEDERRYVLLETIRQYAAEKLQAAEEAEIRGRHAGFFVELALSAEPWLMTSEREAWLRRLDAEHDNMRAALRWSLTHQPETSLRCASALLWFWWFRGYWSEGRAWIEQALARNAGASNRADRAKALLAAGQLAWFQNDYAGARPQLEESEDLYRMLGEEQGLAHALIYGGGALYGQGDFLRARARLEEALAIGVRLGDHWLIALAQLSLGDVVTAQGEPRLGRELLEASIELWRVVGDERLMGYACMYLGQALLALGDYRGAQAQFVEALTIHRRGGQKSGVAISFLGLADVATSEGEYERAGMYCRDALMEFKALDAKQRMAESLERVARLAVVAGRWVPAALLFGATGTLRSAIGAPLPPVQRTAHEDAVATTRDVLGEATFATASAEGQAMTLEQAIAYALEETPDA